MDVLWGCDIGFDFGPGMAGTPPSPAKVCKVSETNDISPDFDVCSG
jgi:hypothetical protein